jgi:hypothetical protein
MKIVLHIRVEFTLVILVIGTGTNHVLRVVLAAVLEQVAALTLRTVRADSDILMLELIILKLIDKVLRVDRVIV